MAKVYKSPTVERVGGGPIAKTESLVAVVYVAAAAVVTATVVNIVTGVNVFVLWNTTYFWGVDAPVGPE